MKVVTTSSAFNGNFTNNVTQTGGGWNRVRELVTQVYQAYGIVVSSIVFGFLNPTSQL